MSGNEMQSLFSDPDYYAKAFVVFNKAFKRQVLVPWAETEFSNAILHRVGVDIAEKPDEKLYTLGIGSGTGEIECAMIAHLLTKFSNVKNTVLEPAENHITKYKTLSGSKNFTGVEWDFRQQTWNDYYQDRVKINNKTKFHYISAIHSLYYVDDFESSVLNIHKCLEEGGILVIVLVSDNSGTSRLWNRYPTFQDDRFLSVNTGMVRDICGKHNIDFDVIKKSSSLDITSCFDEGSEKGSLLVDFLCHQKDLKKTATPAMHADVLEFIRGPECSIKEGDKIFFNNNWEAIVLKK